MGSEKRTSWSFPSPPPYPSLAEDSVCQGAMGLGAHKVPVRRPRTTRKLASYWPEPSFSQIIPRTLVFGCPGTGGAPGLCPDLNPGGLRAAASLKGGGSAGAPRQPGQAEGGSQGCGSGQRDGAPGWGTTGSEDQWDDAGRARPQVTRNPRGGGVKSRELSHLDTGVP